MKCSNCIEQFTDHQWLLSVDITSKCTCEDVIANGKQDNIPVVIILLDKIHRKSELDVHYITMLHWGM